MGRTLLTVPDSTYHFNRTVFDPSSGTLCRDEQPLGTLRPKTAELLQVFLQRPCEVLTQAELCTSIWGETHVSSNVLIQSIKELRQVLGDDPKIPRYIKTHAKRGYEWLVPLDSTEAPISRWPMGLALAATIALIGAIWTLWPGSKIPPPTGDVALLPFVNETGNPDLQWVEHGLRDMLSAALKRGLEINVVPGYAQEARLAETGSAANAADLLQVRNLLGVTHCVLVRVLQSSPYQFNILVAHESGTREVQVTIDQFHDVVPDLTQELGPLLGRPVRTSDLQYLGISPQSQANQAYAEGIQALRTQGSSAAIHHFDRAIILDPEFQWPRVHRAVAMVNLGLVNAARPDFAEAYRQSRWSDPELAAYCLTHWAGLDIEQGEIQSASDRLAEAIAICEAHNYRYGLAHALLKQGYLLTLTGQWSASQVAYQSALQIADDLSDTNTEAHSLLGMATSYQSTEAFEEHEARFRQAISHYQTTRNETSLAKAELAFALLMPPDRHDEREALLDRAHRRFSELAEPFGMAMIDMARGIKALQEMQPNLAVGHFSCALALAEDYDQFLFTAENLRLQGLALGIAGVRAERWDWVDRGIELADLGLQEFRADRVLMGEATCQFVLGMLHAERGNLMLALQRIREARLTFEAAGMTRILAYADIQSAQVEMRRGNWQVAFNLLENANQYFGFKDGRTLELMARCQYETGSYQRALDFQRKALGLKTQHYWKPRSERLHIYEKAVAGQPTPDLGAEPSLALSM